MTIVMLQQTVSKSAFKAQVLEYLRNVEEKKQQLIVTHAGKPVVKIVPYSEKKGMEVISSIRDSVLYYKDPTKPVGEKDWEVLK